MAITELSLYKAAAVELGEERPATLTDGKVALELAAVYADVKGDCLESGLWNFAIRSVKLEADSSIEPSFGFTEIFDKPSDWVRTAAFTANDNFDHPLPDHDYRDEVGFWAATQSPIYVQYVSNDAAYGENLALWPSSYRRFVEVALADRICMTITQNVNDKQALEGRLFRAERYAKNKDAMNEGAKFRRRGSWNDARYSGSRRDRGNRNSFTG